MAWLADVHHSPEVQDGIQHQLARPVVGHLPATLRPVQLRAKGRRGGVEAEVRGTAAGAQGVHRRVLQHQQLVRRLLPSIKGGQAAADEGLLPRPGACVRHLTEGCHRQGASALPVEAHAAPPRL